MRLMRINKDLIHSCNPRDNLILTQNVPSCATSELTQNKCINIDIYFTLFFLLLQLLGNWKYISFQK